MSTLTKMTSTTDSLGLLLRDLDQYPMPDHEQQIALAKRVAAAGDEAGRRQMVAANLRLVVHWARRYQDRGVDSWPTWCKRAPSACCRAVEKFDWEQRLPFLHLRHLVDPPGPPACGPAAWPYHPDPLEVGERLQRIDAVTAELAGQLGRQSPPTEDELTELTGLTTEERRSLEDVARVTASLDQPAAADSSTSLGDLVAPDGDNWAERVDQEMVFERVRDAVERLPELQRDVLRLRFGFNGDSPASLQTTAERLGVGVRRVRRAEEEALAALSADGAVVGAHDAAA